MNKQDYEKIKFESWIEFFKEHPIETPSMSIGEAFDFAFDRAYALGKQDKDAEGEEMLSIERVLIQSYYNAHKNSRDILYDLFGPKCLPDNVDSLSQNFPEKYDKANRISTDDNKPSEPKFKVGDKVVYIGENQEFKGRLFEIDGEIFYNDYHRNMQVSSIKCKDYNVCNVPLSDLEPYTEPEEKSRNLSQETANCDKHFDNILKDGFSKERRLNIATQIMSSILSNQMMLNNLAHGETTAEGVVKCIVDTTMMYTDALLAECEKGGRYDAGTVR